MTKEKEITLLEKNYLEDLNKIKETIKTNQNKAMVVVNSAMIMTYYQIGMIINERKQWGNKYIERLSNDLKEYGKGYSIRNLQYMKKLAVCFKKEEFVHQVGAQIPWRTLIEIMENSNSHEEMLWYINQTHKNGWSRAMVLNQFKLKAYERTLIEPITSSTVKSNDLTKELFKDTYVFDFIDVNHIHSEKDLEVSLVNNVTKFILELGEGFAFIGRQYHLEISNKDYYIDLLFYNLKIHSYVVIELKIGEFKPDYIGQLIFYVNTIDMLLKTDMDNPTIGLLLCSNTDKLIAKNTLKGTILPLGISKYKFIEELPIYLEKRLKDIKEKNNND